jgi:hypothetical protein
METTVLLTDCHRLAVSHMGRPVDTISIFSSSLGWSRLEFEGESRVLTGDGFCDMATLCMCPCHRHFLCVVQSIIKVVKYLVVTVVGNQESIPA